MPATSPTTIISSAACSTTSRTPASSTTRSSSSMSDNGASGEGGPNGSFNEWRFFNGIADSTDHDPGAHRRAGRPKSYNHYNTGWAWALDTPFPYWKRWAGAEGGVADMCFISWPAKIKASKEVRPQYIHAVDVVPTIYELLDIDPPEVLKGYTQSPIEGESFAASLTDATVPGKRTQFYTMLGQRSIYHEGWLAIDAASAAQRLGQLRQGRVGAVPPRDRSLAEQERLAQDDPVRLESLKNLWSYYAGVYNASRHSTTAPRSSRCSPNVRSAAPDRNRYDVLPELRRRPRDRRRRRSTAARTRSPPGVTLDSDAAEGVLFAHGGVAGGHSLYVKDQSSALRVQLGRHHGADDHVRPRDQRRRPRLHRRVRHDRTEHRSRHARLRGHADALHRRPSRRDPTSSEPSPASSVSSVTASASGATTRRRSHPTTPTAAPSTSPVARSTGSSSTCPAIGTSTTRRQSAGGS